MKFFIETQITKLLELVILTNNNQNNLNRTNLNLYSHSFPFYNVLSKPNVLWSANQKCFQTKASDHYSHEQGTNISKFQLITIIYSNFKEAKEIFNLHYIFSVDMLTRDHPCSLSTPTCPALA
jgi:hypothetical protein